MNEPTIEAGAAGEPERIPLRPMVIVGLGGTGRWLCSRLKRLYRERLGRVPPHVALLSIDSVRKQPFDATVDVLDEPGEIMSLSIANPLDYVEKLGDHSPWFPRTRGDLRRKIVEVNQLGCGATRPIGRVLIEANWTTVHTRLKNLSEQVAAKVARARAGDLTAQAEFAAVGFTRFEDFEREPSFLICGNLVSGTGSGAFLEIAYIVRLLSGVYDSIGVFTLPPEADHDVQHLVNATAALRELQHYMAVDSLPPELRYHCRTIAAEPLIRMAPAYNTGRPYSSVLLARPHLSDPKELERLQEQIARFLYGFTATPLGILLRERKVNLSTNATVTGDVPVICSFGAYELEDDSTQRGRLLHLMLADFFADNITGRFNHGEQQKHTTWAAPEMIPTATEHLRMILGLPSGSVEATPFSPDGFIAACRELLEHVRAAATRRMTPRILGRDVQLDPSSIANAIVSDPLVRAARDANGLQQSLLAQIPKALKALDPTVDAVLTDVVEGRLRELLAAVNKDLFETGASLDQTLGVLEHLVKEVDHLARRMPEMMKRQLEPVFSIDNVAATLRMLAGRRVNNFLGETVFLDEIKSEIGAYLNRKLAGVATRIIHGEPGQSVPLPIGGVQFDLAAGLSKNLQTIIDTLRKVQKVIEAAGVRLEDEGNLRDVRDVASEPELRSLYAKGAETLLSKVKEIRRNLLDALKCESLIGAANVEPATMAQHLKNVTRSFVPEPERKPFARWWDERGLRTIDETTLAAACSLLPFSDAGATAERYDMTYAIAVQSPASNGEPPLSHLNNIPRVIPPGALPNDKDNSVRLMVIRGHAMLRWMVNFERLTANYAHFQSEARLMEDAHTVSGFERLRPIVFGPSERMIWYLVGCAIGVIVPTNQGALYRYRDSDLLIDEAPQQWQYSTSEDVDEDRGPVHALFAKIPEAGTDDGPPTLPMIERPNATSTSAPSLFQHLHSLLNARLLNAKLSGAEKKQRATDLYRLLTLYLSQLGAARAGIESAHIDPRKVKSIDVFGWTNANFGNIGNKDVLLNELRQEMRQSNIPQLIARYRAATTFDIDDAPAATPPATTATATTAILPNDPAAPKLPVRSDTERRHDINTILEKAGVGAMTRVRVVKALEIDLEQMVGVAEKEGLSGEIIDALVRIAMA